MGVFDLAYDELPPDIPVFPLAGVLLLPRGQLPLNIFEPRYLAMTRAALASRDRLIGMIQPTVNERTSMNPPLFPIGCAGRLVQFSETEDGRYLISLNGVCRFNIVEELPLTDGYRRVVADWSRYQSDFAQPQGDGIDRERFLKALRSYLDRRKMQLNWDAVKSAPTEQIVNSLAMMCPFNPGEKQALLEAVDLPDRAGVMLTLLEMGSADSSDGGSGLN